MNQMNPIHTVTTYYFKIYYDNTETENLTKLSLQ